MKSILIWLVACVIGAAAGYMTALFFGFNGYLWSGLGVIAGSSAGMTINIHRSRDKDFSDDNEHVLKEADTGQISE